MSGVQQAKAEKFLAMHDGAAPLLLANAWDEGSAKLLGSLGFEALATTSSGYAATLGRLDGSASRDEVLHHARAIVGATTLPVSADLENCFAEDPSGVAQTVGLAVETGLAGCSVEDFTGRGDSPIYEAALAFERVVAAAEVAHCGPVHFVLTARAENHVRGVVELSDTIARLQSYQEAGADVLFAPGLTRIEDVRQIVASVDRPVNVLVRPDGPTVSELAAVGVRRISIGGAFAFAALGAVVEASRELREEGTYGFWKLARAGSDAARWAFQG